MARVLSMLVFMLSCAAVASAQSLKGSAAAAEAAAAAPAVVEAVKLVDAKAVAVEATELGELPKQHPPTSNQAVVAFALIFLVPILGIAVMMKGKDKGWEGAFGTICCLILFFWIYSAVAAL